MRILALETSGSAGGVAALQGDRTLAESALPPGQRSAQTLAPAIRSTLAAVGWLPQDVQLVAVTQGPGSFTGLRIGAATAKTFAYAVGAEILGVNTLQVLAAQCPADCREVWTLVDAQRGQLFVGRYSPRGAGLPEELERSRVELIEDWLHRYSPSEWIAGPGAARVAARLPAGARLVEAAHSAPQATTVGRLAWLLHQQGERHDVWGFAPQYYRASAAEEKHGT